MRRLGCWWFALLLAMSLVAGPALAQVVDRVMAVVGDEVITSQDVEKMMRTLEQQVSAVSRPGEVAPTEGQVRRMALDRLVEDKIFAAEVKRDKINVSKEELESFVDRVKKANNLGDDEFLAQLSRRGLTMDEYREELRRDILKHKLLDRNVKSKVVISEDQVEKFYRETYGGGQDSSQVRLRALFLKVPDDASPAAEQTIKQRAEELRKQVTDGADFADLARKHSQGPGADQGGELGVMSATDMLPAMRLAVIDLKPGGISPVVKVPAGYVFMQLIERGGSAVTLPAKELKDQIRTKLENEALDKRFKEWITDLRSKVYVKIIE